MPYSAMIPLSASDFLREKSPRKAAGNSFLSSNRFHPLRSDSPAMSESGSYRNRSLSVKRKNDDSASYANAAKRSVTMPIPTATANAPDNTQLLAELDTVEINIAKVKSLCESVESSLSEASIDPAIISIFGDIITVLSYTAKTHESLLNANRLLSATPASKPQPDFVSLGSIPGPARAPLPANKPARANATPALSAEDAEKSRFKDTIREAEKSILVFNLDMGRVPIMNKSTMSRKATGALLAMAAAVEGTSSSIPSDDTVAAIDDLLSVTENMSFFGATTKTYRNVNDPSNAAFCTVPVKYEFKDKDTRIRAETLLRSKCKVNCSVPYPVIIRECIKQAVKSGKAARPESYVRVNVDPANLCLKLAWRAKTEKQWTNHSLPIPLPPEVLNTKARTAPDNLVLENLPTPSATEMDVVPSSPTASATMNIPSGVRPTTRSATRSPKGQNTPKR